MGSVLQRNELVVDEPDEEGDMSEWREEIVEDMTLPSFLSFLEDVKAVH